MAAVSRYISYGPVRRSGTALVTEHEETGVAMAPHMPTTPGNVRRALHHDWQWWSDRGDEMKRALQRLAGALSEVLRGRARDGARRGAAQRPG